MPRRPPFAERLGDLALGLLSKLLPRQFHFDLAERTNLGIDGGQPCAAERRSLGGGSAGLLGHIEIGDTTLESRAQLDFRRSYSFLGGLDGDPAGAPIFRSPLSSAGFRQAFGPWHGNLFGFRK